jgi:hypothetical protein
VFDLLGELLGGVIGEVIGDWRRRRRSVRLQRSSRLLCSLRVLDGSQAGLNHRWRHVKATLSPGCIQFRPRPWRQKVRIPVRSASRLHERHPRGAAAWVLDPRMRIVDVGTGTATLEWAVLGEQLPWALAEVRKQPHEVVVATG